MCSISPFPWSHNNPCRNESRDPGQIPPYLETSRGFTSNDSRFLGRDLAERSLPAREIFRVIHPIHLFEMKFGIQMSLVVNMWMLSNANFCFLVRKTNAVCCAASSSSLPLLHIGIEPNLGFLLISSGDQATMLSVCLMRYAPYSALFAVCDRQMRFIDSIAVSSLRLPQS